MRLKGIIGDFYHIDTDRIYCPICCNKMEVYEITEDGNDKNILETHTFGGAVILDGVRSRSEKAVTLQCPDCRTECRINLAVEEYTPSEEDIEGVGRRYNFCH